MKLPFYHIFFGLVVLYSMQILPTEPIKTSLAPHAFRSVIFDQENLCDQAQLLAVLASIKKQINTLDTAICRKFQETWTILDALNITPSVDLNSVFTKLDFVCGKIEDGFAGTFSILDTVTTTASIDLNSVFTKLDGICDKLEDGFQDTLSVINNFTVTVTIDFSGVFTKLDFVCDKLENGFQDTFSIVDGLTVTAFIDLNSVCTQLDTICNKIEDGFQGTFSIVNILTLTAVVDLSSVFTALEGTCDKIEAGFADTFSTVHNIEQDIIFTQTIICDKFLQTWTILSEIEDSLGCPSIPITQAAVDAGGGTFSITASGNYFIAQDIVSDGGIIIFITSPDVSLDMCGRTLSGNFTNGGIIVDQDLSNIRIGNGTIKDVSAGIFISNGVCDFLLERITTFSASMGFMVNDFFDIDANLTSNGLLNECQAKQCNTGLLMTRCTSIAVHKSNFSENMNAPSVFGTSMIRCSNCLFNLCTMNNNFGQEICRGLSADECSNNVFESCVFNGNKNMTDTFFGFNGGAILNNCINTIFRNCQASQNISPARIDGFLSLGGSNNVCINCVASNNNGPGADFTLIQEEGSQLHLCQSLAHTATNTGNPAMGFSISQGSNNLIEHCQAIGTLADSLSAGFILGAETGSALVNCIEQGSTSLTDTGYGILLTTDMSCLVKNNIVMTTTGVLARFGYRDDTSPASTSLFTGNIAFNNGINYDVVYPSGPLPVVSGSLSGGLPATGTSGTFDNISIDI